MLERCKRRVDVSALPLDQTKVDPGRVDIRMGVDRGAILTRGERSIAMGTS